VDHDLPVSAANEWQRWDPDAWRSDVTPAAAHPQVVDQRYLVNWNNKPARGYASSDVNAYSSVYRSDLLEDRLRAAIASDRKLTLPGLIDVMEVAGPGDLRAQSVLPLALELIGRPRGARLRAAVDALRAWRAAGGLRKDADGDGRYQHGVREYCGRGGRPVAAGCCARRCGRRSTCRAASCTAVTQCARTPARTATSGATTPCASGRPAAPRSR